jgi:hypothetical protein
MKKTFLFIMPFLLLLLVQFSFADELPGFQQAGINCGNPAYANGRWDNFNVSVRYEKTVINGVSLPVVHYIIDGKYSPSVKVSHLDTIRSLPVSVLKNMEILAIGNDTKWLVPKDTILTSYIKGEDGSWRIDAVNCKTHTWIEFYLTGNDPDTLKAFGLLPGKPYGLAKLTHKVVSWGKNAKSNMGEYFVDNSYAIYLINKLSGNWYSLLTMSKVTGDPSLDTMIFLFNAKNT